MVRNLSVTLLPVKRGETLRIPHSCTLDGKQVLYFRWKTKFLYGKTDSESLNSSWPSEGNAHDSLKQGR